VRISKSITTTDNWMAYDSNHSHCNDLSITIKNGIATLSGTSVSYTESIKTEKLISQMKGVKHTINLITY